MMKLLLILLALYSSFAFAQDGSELSFDQRNDLASDLMIFFENKRGDKWNFSNTIPLLEENLKEKPGDPLSTFNLVELIFAEAWLGGFNYKAEGKNRAGSIVTIALKEHPEHYLTHVMAAKYFTRLKNRKKMYFHYDQARKFGGDNKIRYYSSFSYSNGKLDLKMDYIRFFKKALELDAPEKLKIKIRGEIARQLIDTKKYDEALAQYKIILRNDKVSEFDYYNYGRLLKKMNRQKEALVQFQKALELRFHYGAYWSIDSLYHDKVHNSYRANDFVGTLAYAEEALDYKKTIYPAYLRARAYHKRNRINKAYNNYVLALDMLDTDFNTRFVIKYLDQIIRKKDGINDEYFREWETISENLTSIIGKLGVTHHLIRKGRIKKIDSKKMEAYYSNFNEYTQTLSKMKTRYRFASGFIYSMTLFEYGKYKNDHKTLLLAQRSITQMYEGYNRSDILKKYKDNVDRTIKRLKIAPTVSKKISGTGQKSNMQLIEELEQDLFNTKIFTLKHVLYICLGQFLFFLIIFLIRYLFTRKKNKKHNSVAHVQKVEKVEKPKKKSRPLVTGLVTIALCLGSLELLKANGIRVFGIQEIYTSIVHGRQFSDPSQLNSYKKVAELKNWPPQKDKSYPDMELIDSNGKELKISDFKGQPILVEVIGMTCPGCHAFNGGHSKVERLGNVKPQKGIEEFATYYKAYTRGLDLFDGPVKFIQLVTYDLDGKKAQPDDAKVWAKHFFPEGLPSNVIVAVPKKSLISMETYKMIPSFHLIDKGFNFRSNGAGHALYQETLPLMAEVIEE